MPWFLCSSFASISLAYARSSNSGTPNASIPIEALERPLRYRPLRCKSGCPSKDDEGRMLELNISCRWHLSRVFLHSAYLHAHLQHLLASTIEYFATDFSSSLACPRPSVSRICSWPRSAQTYCYYIPRREIVALLRALPFSVPVVHIVGIFVIRLSIFVIDIFIAVGSAQSHIVLLDSTNVNQHGFKIA